MDRGAWKAAVHGVAKSQTRLSDFTFTFHFHALEKEMATHSSVFLPGESQGRGSLVGCRLWGRTESDRLKRLSSTPLFETLQRSPLAATITSKLLHLSYNVFTDLYLNFQLSAILPHTKQTKKALLPPPSPPPSTGLTVYLNAMHLPHSTWKITFISQSSAQVLPLL